MSELVITPDNWRSINGDGEPIHFDGHERKMACKRRTTVYGAAPFTKPVHETMDLIPRSEWDSLIELNDREESWAYNRMERAGMECKDQDGNGTCWIYAGTQCVEERRIFQDGRYVSLCPESAGLQVTSRPGEGGTLEDTLEGISKFGPALSSMCPDPYKLSSKLWISGWEANGSEHKLTEWVDLDQGQKVFDWCATAALRGMPAWYAYMRVVFRGHAVIGSLRLRKKDGKYQLMCRNSWGKSYGENGYFWVTSGPDGGAFTAAVAKASEV